MYSKRSGYNFSTSKLLHLQLHQISLSLLRDPHKSNKLFSLLELQHLSTIDLSSAPSFDYITLALHSIPALMT